MVKRIKVEDEAEEEPKVRGSKEVSRKAFDTETCIVYFRPKVSDFHTKIETRQYFVGCIPLAFVDVYKDGFQPPGKKEGKFVAFMPDGRGNTGEVFATEKQLHAFLLDLLYSKPTF